VTLDDIVAPWFLLRSKTRVMTGGGWEKLVGALLRVCGQPGIPADRDRDDTLL